MLLLILSMYFGYMFRFFILVLGFFLVGCQELGQSSEQKPPVGRLALSFDDTYIDGWHKSLDVFDKYDAQATFFVTRYTMKVDNNELQDLLLDIQNRGHEIGFHTTYHHNGPEYVAENGMSEYLRVEIDLGMSSMLEDGFDVTSIAFPFGITNEEINEELKDRFHKLRGFRSANFSDALSDGKGEYLMAAGIDAHVFNFDKIMDAIDEANENGSLLILASHNIDDTCENSNWCITTSNLERVLDYAQSTGMAFVKFNEI
ncbi:polysaccharide deacetylase family protein [Ferrimonas balearica]|uniref:polysaccharide deacetylase family protein n=1 Tax=Ferrimonas balearica TaxID=44012 RepID=UPI001C988F09|nr:polysaccharide deacetylase family protein [Ferrimonas balearica]MBY5980550.1 polysaccharide deacetylase family protein [Ferrimonas balearica]